MLPQEAFNLAEKAGFSGESRFIIVAIATAESGLNAGAINCDNPGNSCDRGILQINSFWHPEVTDACAYDPACAFQQGYRISKNGTDFNAWTTYQNGAYKQFLGKGVRMNWYEYPVGVPFGDANYDVGVHGSHDMTFLTPVNIEITQLASGTISDISYPSWGAQVCIKLDEPVNGHLYFAILHLAAVNPALKVGQHMEPLELVGWSGGCNNAKDYGTTSNPTGENFIDSADQSSQPQTGIALHDGPAYGGLGWSVWPPIDQSLDPRPVLSNFQAWLANRGKPTNYKEEQAHLCWIATDKQLVSTYQQSANEHSDIHDLWLAAYMTANINAGPPATIEMPWIDWSGKQGTCMWFLSGYRIEDIHGVRIMYGPKDEKIFS